MSEPEKYHWWQVSFDGLDARFEEYATSPEDAVEQAVALLVTDPARPLDPRRPVSLGVVVQPVEGGPPVILRAGLQYRASGQIRLALVQRLFDRQGKLIPLGWRGDPVSHDPAPSDATASRITGLRAEIERRGDALLACTLLVDDARELMEALVQDGGDICHRLVEVIDATHQQAMDAASLSGPVTVLPRDPAAARSLLADALAQLSRLADDTEASGSDIPEDLSRLITRLQTHLTPTTETPSDD